MPRKEIRSYLLVALLYAFLVTFVGQNFQIKFLLFWLGAVVGVLLLYLDPLATSFLTSPDLPFSQEIKGLISQKKYKELLLTVIAHHRSQVQPILHSALFQAALTFLSFYIVTSSGSFFGTGLVLGMALHLIYDEIRLWRTPEELDKMLFWNIHREISLYEQKIYLVVIFALFGLETILLF